MFPKQNPVQENALYTLFPVLSFGAGRKQDSQHINLGSIAVDNGSKDRIWH